MQVNGVFYPGNNLPEANTRNLRVNVKRKEEQDQQLEWLQTMFETYSKHLNHFQKQLDHTLPQHQIDEIKELIIDAEQRLAAMQLKLKQFNQ